MPISLTTAFNPGNFDSGNTYPRAKIVAIHFLSVQSQLRIKVDFGDVSEGLWVSGGGDKEMPQKMRHYLIRDDAEAETTDYSDLIADAPEEGETTYEAVKRAVYAYLIDNVAELAGVVE